MKFRTGKRPHRAAWANAPIWGLSQHKHVKDGPSVRLTLEDHHHGQRLIDLEFTAEDVRGPYFDVLIQRLEELRDACTIKETP